MTGNDRPTQGATVYGAAGENTRLAGIWRLTWPLACALFLAGYLLRAAFPWRGLTTVRAGWGLLALGMGLLLLVTRRYRRAGAFFVGAKGEQEVARILAGLPGEYKVFHGVRLPGAARGPSADLDHVVLGPAGIWVVETKSWTGPVTLANGQLRYDNRLPQRSPIDQVRQGALALGGALQARLGGVFSVQALVCFAGNRFQAEEELENGVVICNADRLRDVLLRPHSSSPGLEAGAGIERTLREWLHA